MKLARFFLKALLPVAFALITTVSVAQSDDVKATTKKFNTLLSHIELSYVDSVDKAHLTEEAIKGMLKELDPHSIYIPKKEVDRMKEPLRGNFEGVGIRFNILRDTILVVSPIPGGPSEKIGILSGDKIVEIEGENVAGNGVTNSDVRDKLRGEKGTEVNVGVKRSGESQLLDFTITRDKIPLTSVDASYMATPDIGYIKVNRFAGNTIKEFEKGLQELNENGMKNLILDLQGNGGGYLKTAIQMADEFLGKNQLIVYTEGRAYPKREKFAQEGGGFEDGKLVVMIDESSASASEIVSGAVQDWDRGLIVGRRSFGKGLVQRPITLPDGSMVRLTISRYHTPSGRCIQKPYDDGREAYAKEKYERYNNGEVFHKDSIDVADSLVYQTKVNKRKVYGGGGILPDFFVPVDTSGNSELYRKIRRKGILNNHVLTYTNDHRDELEEKYEDVNALKADFDVKPILEGLKEKAAEKDIEWKEEQYQDSKKWIDTQIKGLVARNLWGHAYYYQVVNEINDSYRKALDILQDDTFEKLNLAHSE